MQRIIRFPFASLTRECSGYSIFYGLLVHQDKRHLGEDDFRSEGCKPKVGYSATKVTKKSDAIKNPKPAGKTSDRKSPRAKGAVRAAATTCARKEGALRSAFDTFGAISYALLHPSPCGHLVKRAGLSHLSQTDLTDAHCQDHGSSYLSPVSPSKSRERITTERPQRSPRLSIRAEQPAVATAPRICSHDMSFPVPLGCDSKGGERRQARGRRSRAFTPHPRDGTFICYMGARKHVCKMSV